MTTPQPGYGQQPHQSTDPQQGSGSPVPTGYGVPAPGHAPAGHGAPAPAGYGAPVPSPQGDGAQAAIDLTIQGNVMMRSFVPPTVWVNGHALTAKYGQRLVPVAAGPVRVDVECQWLRKYGQASLTFDAQPGQTVPVFYAAPMHQFTTGNIGHVKQKYKGLGFVWGIVGFAIAVILLSFLLPVLLG